MPRINLAVNDDNYQFLKQMKDSGRADSLSHAARMVIQEYRKLAARKSRVGENKMGFDVG